MEKKVMIPEISFIYICYRDDINSLSSTNFFLQKQKKVWSDLIPQENIEIIFIDDCSSPPIEIDEVKPETELNFHMYRINDDIKWNIGGARNLGVEMSHKKWVYVLDLDLVLNNQIVRQLLETVTQINSKPCYFKTNRQRKDKPVPPGCFCIKKEDFQQYGKYDEDYAGDYSCGEKLLYRRLNQKLQYMEFPNIVLEYIDDPISKTPAYKNARQITNRKKKLDQMKFQQIDTGVYQLGKTLRFNWKKII